MGMSASQARLLSLTARMHDLEFQAQAFQYAKLDLVNLKTNEYEEYMEILDSTKFQMAVITPTGKEFQDITYTNMIMANTSSIHSMYTITNAATGQILLPEQIASKLGPDPHDVDPLKAEISAYKTDEDGNVITDENGNAVEKTVEEKLDEYLTSVAKKRVFPDGKDKNGAPLTTDAQYLAAIKGDDSYEYWKTQYYEEFPDKNEFLLTVAKNYLYANRIDITENSEYISEMKKDGNYDYWNAIYYQIIGYEDEDGTPIRGRGFCPISQQNAVDRDWLAEALNSGEVQLFKMTKESTLFNNNKINIFAETSMATDTELTEVANQELIAKAAIKYEKAIDDIDAKETKLDLRLAQIDTEHNALKTEYDSVKQIVSKNIDRSFKSFNA